MKKRQNVNKGSFLVGSKKKIGVVVIQTER